MIGRICGILISKTPPLLLVDVNGVGYELQVSMQTLFTLPELTKPVILLTHLVVREDAQLLFGFHTADERAVFRELIKISGVGPKLALAILSGLKVEELMRCVEFQDLARLTTIPGVGKKTAERLMIEMRNKLTTFNLNIASFASASSTTSATSEAMSALVSLGYKPIEAQKALNKFKDEDISSEEMIKLALQGIAGKVSST